MTRSRLTVLFAVAVAVAVAAAVAPPHPTAVWAQDKTELTGRWTLNRELSQFPAEVGFGLDWASAGGSVGGSTPASGGRGRRGSSGGSSPAFTAQRESEDDAKRLRQLTAEVRSPSAHLTIVETPTAVTIADDRGQSRTFQPDGREHVLQLDGVPVGVTAKREAGRLVVLYSVEQGRDLRYSYSRAASPPQLVVEVQFVERGGGDRVRRVYEPASASEALPTAAAAPSPPPTTGPPSDGPLAGRRTEPAKPVGAAAASTDRVSAEVFNQQPDAELKGLTTLGLLVEDLGPQAALCGLNQSVIEAAVSKRLSESGFKVLRNSDEDTYVYVNVMTTNLSAGLCVSRYDAFLYTHTTAKLSYQQTPVLVQVSLLHRGGIAGGGSTTHAEGVLKGVQEYVGQFATRIKDANK